MAWNYGNTVLVFFDLETSGLSSNCDILQIAMKSGNAAFNQYVQPTKPVDPQATELHGLTNVNGTLYRYGQAIPSRSIYKVMHDMLSFLQSFGKPCILIAHNCYGFDAPRIMRAIKLCSLEAAFQSALWGFADSFVLFRDLFPSRKLTLTNLASELLNVNVEFAHDAFYDTQLLESLVCKYFNYNTIVKSARSFTSFDW